MHHKISLAISPIGWTNDDMPELGGDISFSQCIAEMQESGFEGCELGTKFSRDPVTLRKELDAHGLRLCNAWFSTEFTRRAPEHTYQAFVQHRDLLHHMGATLIGCSEQGNSIQQEPISLFAHKPVFSEDQWQQVARGYRHLVQLAEEKSMKVAIHHHMGTGIQTREEIDRFLSLIPGAYLLYDTGHLYYSEESQDVITQTLKDYLSRTIHVHLKDIRIPILQKVKTEGLSFCQGVKEGVFTVPGDGDLDFSPIFSLLSQYEGWWVVEAEQDPYKANPLEYAKKARAFIKKETGL